MRSGVRQRITASVLVLLLLPLGIAVSVEAPSAPGRGEIDLNGCLPSFHDMLMLVGNWLGESDKALSQPWQQVCTTAAAAGQASDQTLNEIAKQLAALEKLLDNVRQWDEGLEQHAGQGAVDRMLIAAEQCALERKHRRLIQKETQQLLVLVKRALSVHDRTLQEQVARLQWLDQRLREASAVQYEEPHPISELPLDEIEYFQVQTSADLKAISALPDVYGDSSLWKVLYQANKDKLVSETAAVPVGMVLIVPNVETAREFQFK